jgi:methyl-accepting chemotaxis protein
MIHDGTARIEEGVSRTQQAQQRLEKIISSAQRSSDVVSEIADALDVQMTTSRKVKTTMERLHAMTVDITTSTNKQRITTMQIQDAVEHISELATQTHQDTREQLKGVKLVLNTTDTVKNLSDQNLESSKGINHVTTTNLAEQAQILLQSVDRFRL